MPSGSGVRTRVVSKRVVLADVPRTPETGTRVQKTRNDGTKNWNAGTKNGTMVPKAGMRVHSPRPPFTKPLFCFLSSGRQLENMFQQLSRCSVSLPTLN